MPILKEDTRGLKPEKDATDEELVRGCINGDRRCEQALYRRYSAKMLGVCRRYCKRLEEAEDIFQEGFLKAFDGLSSFKFQGSFEGWLRRIMVNAAITYYHRMKGKEVLPFEDDFDAEVVSGVVEKISARELMSLIDELPAGYRMVFNLFAIEGYSHKEIAEMMNINEGTSRSQLNKARQQLQKRLGVIDKKTETQITLTENDI